MSRRGLGSIALACVAAAGALAAAGCGEGSDEDQITSVIEDTYAAYGEGDAETFCGNLSSDYLPDFEDYYGQDCEAVVTAAAPALSEEQLSVLESPDVSDITIEGDVAQTTTAGEDLEVVSEDGEWKLDDFDVPDRE